jgi:hypothetical protein
MEKKEKFIKIPRSIDKDPRLLPWMQKNHVNPYALTYAIICMIDRLYQEKEMTLSDLLEGISRKHLPYRMLKEIVVASGFFNYEDGHVCYDWDRFTRKFVEKAPIRPQSGPNEAPTTPARDLKATNVDKDIDVDVDNSHTKKEKEKKESAPISGDGYESRIHDIVLHYPFREGELVGWGGKLSFLFRRHHSGQSRCP